MANTFQKGLLVGSTGYVLWRSLVGRLREADLTGEVALVTGGSRGLGLLLAREYGRAGCRVAICARDAEELDRARTWLAAEGIEAHTVVCDVGDEAHVAAMIADVTAHHGRVDILVNNAGQIQVGPVQQMVADDFREMMHTIFWGTLYPTLAVLPQMRERGAGRIVNVTSVGGKIAVPHLLPYSAAKFAATGLSEGLRAELKRDGITVTTVAPGEIRTGSYIHATFKGDEEAEFRWFALGDNLPFNSIDAERAARIIVGATKRGEAERILTAPAVIGSFMHGVAPGFTSDVLALANRYGLPAPTNPADTGKERGETIEARVSNPVFDTLLGFGKSAAARFNQRKGGSDRRNGHAPDRNRALVESLD